MSQAKFRHMPGYDRHGRINLMARSGGYVMVRRPRCAPFVLTEKAWAKLDAEPWDDDRITAFDAAEAKKRADADRLVAFLTGRRP